MKTLKIMSILGIIIAVIAFACQCGWTPDTASNAIGWGVIAESYMLAFAIVGIVQAHKHK